MNENISLPDRRSIRRAIGPNIAAWAKRRGHKPSAVHNTIQRYAGTDADMLRAWGDATRAILRDLDAAIRAAQRRGPASSEEAP